MRNKFRTLKRVLLTTLFLMTLSSVVDAGASALSTVTFTTPAPSSLVANTASTWTIGLTPSSSGSLGAGSSITVTFPSGFTTSSTAPVVTLKTPSAFLADCTATGVDANEQNVVTINLTTKTGTCALAINTAATLSIGVVNGASATYGGSNFSVATSADTTAVNPAASAKITATSVTAVNVTPTSKVKDAASTWVWGFTTSSTGALGAGDIIEISFASSFSTITTAPTVVLESPASFASGCTETDTDPSMGNVIDITLANNGANTCALGALTAATLSVAVVNGTGDGFSNMTVSTTLDTSATGASGTAITLTAPTKVTLTSFTSTAPTSLVANTASTWTVKFSTSSAGALAAGDYIEAAFPTGFTTSSVNPSVVLQTPSTFPVNCTAVASDPTMSNTVTVFLANNGSNTCSLAVSTATVLTFAVVNGLAATYTNSTYSLLTSVDGASVSPTSGSETIVVAGPPGLGSNWALSSPNPLGEAASGAGPGPVSSVQGGATFNYMCDSTTSEQVDLAWTGVAQATSYIIEQASSAAGPYSAVSPAPVFSGTTPTITYTTAVTQYYEVEAVIGTAWVGTPSGVAINGTLSPGFVITATSSPKCTNN